jgi:hypothetical protein
LPEPAGWLAGLVAEAGLRYALIGGHAVNYWARPRFTQDFDFTVVADREGVAALETRLQAAGFRYVVRQDTGTPSGPDFIRMARDGQPTVFVDIQTSKTPLQDWVIETAATAEPGGVRVARPEALIVLKLIAGRHKDLDDIERLNERGDIDWDTVLEHGAPWGVAEDAGRFRTGR